ncbi:Bug family tripartite tricarboxylate transporter substrate binding protein [Bordetella petrii]|uniref:Bug family tripartite tricarboxylate transporter substrate binding protein n=1 Tax=Bordetella petrii TaxID=94624 RepID=UPI0038B35E8D
MKILRTMAGALLCCFSATALSAGYPDRPIHLIVAYPAGGSTDMIARVFAEKLGEELRQSVVIENKPGAGTNIGASVVNKAKPDGYTILFGGGTPTINSVFGPVPPFDPVKGFEPVSMITRVPFMVAAGSKAPFASLAEMLAKAKASPDTYTISSAQLHLYVELMKVRAQAPIMHVPYKGGAQASTDAIGGQVDAVFSLVPVLLPHIQSGHLKALAVSAQHRVAVLPAVPTFKESGVDYDIGVWFGLLAPPGTPQPIVDRLAEATRRIVAQPSFVARLDEIGAEAVSTTPAQLRDHMEAELQQWRALGDSVPELRRAVGKR